MQLQDILAQTGGLSSIAKELGVSESQATTGAAALLPSILGGLQKQAQTHTDSPAGLGGLLNQLGGGGLLDDVLSPQPTNTNLGNNVLGQIFGSKDVSHAVAQQAGTHSGLDPSLLKKMLPMLAMLVTGYLAKQHGQASAAAPTSSGGGLGGLLGGLLGGGASSGQSSGQSNGMAGGIASMLDRNGNGNPLDDVLGMLGKR